MTKPIESKPIKEEEKEEDKDSIDNLGNMDLGTINFTLTFD